MALRDDLKNVVGDRLLCGEPMSAHTTLGVGGPADYFVILHNEDELSQTMALVSRTDVPWMIVGDGANLLVSDKGIRGVVIRLAGEFLDVLVDSNRITAGSSAKISTVADKAAENNLAGLEGVGTVPGSVGGAIIMNAGTHIGYIDEVTDKVHVVTSKGEKIVFGRTECGFSYRNSRFQTEKGLIVTRVEFAMREGDGTQIATELERMRNRRKETQPQGKSAGCFFKNAPNMSAGKLIQASGGMGLTEGGAIVSDVHANFVLNTGNATASDLFALSERVRKLVRDKQGIDLEYEVRLVGEW